MSGLEIVHLHLFTWRLLCGLGW